MLMLYLYKKKPQQTHYFLTSKQLNLKTLLNSAQQLCYSATCAAESDECIANNGFRAPSLNK